MRRVWQWPTVAVLAGMVSLSAGCEDMRMANLDWIFDRGKDLAARPTIGEREEVEMARAAAGRIEQERQIWDDPLLQPYLTNIVQRLIAHAHERPFEYSIKVVADPTLNAFTPGGGHIFLHTGLLARLESEAQLAAIIGHEMAHITERHIPRGIIGAYDRQLLTGTLADITIQSGTISSAAVEVAHQYTTLAMVNGHGRDLEAEADEVGLEYLVAAGYDPREMAAAFALFRNLYGDPPPVQHFFHGDHPTSVARYERMNELIAEKYSDVLQSQKLIVNTEEYKRRTRQLVILTGISDYERGQFGSARALFEKAIRVTQSDPVPYYYLGLLALNVVRPGFSDVDGAIRSFNKAIEAEPTYANAYRGLGQAYYKKGEHEKALAAFEKYLELNPEAEDAAQIRTSIADLKEF